MSNQTILLTAFSEMSQAQMGKKLGVSKATICKYMNGSLDFTLRRAIQIVKLSRGKVKLTDFFPELKQLQKKDYI